MDVNKISIFPSNISEQSCVVFLVGGADVEFTFTLVGTLFFRYCSIQNTTWRLKLLFKLYSKSKFQNCYQNHGKKSFPDLVGFFNKDNRFLNIISQRIYRVLFVVLNSFTITRLIRWRKFDSWTKKCFYKKRLNFSELLDILSLFIWLFCETSSYPHAQH